MRSFAKIKYSRKLSILQYICLFKMRFTKRVAVWPVGLVTQLRAEGCIVTNGKVRKTPAVVKHGEVILKLQSL